jgi:hypothetical protein
MTTLPLPRDEVSVRDLAEAIRGVDRSHAERDRIAAATGLSRSQVYRAIKDPNQFYNAFRRVADFYGWRPGRCGNCIDPYSFVRRAA